MLVNHNNLFTIPAETAQLAKKVFRKGNRYVTLRDELGVIFNDAEFAHLYAEQGHQGYSAVRLMLVTIIQYMEDLSDREVAEAVRARIDLKYLLGLELGDEGFDHSILSEFRERLIEGKAEAMILNKLLTLCQAKGWLKAGGKQRTDSTHVLAAVRSLSRPELVGETLRATLNEVAEYAPAWLQEKVGVEWYKRYCRRIEAYRLPKEKSQREAWLLQVGKDGQALLQWVEAADTPAVVRELTMVQTLRTVWQQHYHLEGETVRWRKAGELPTAAEMIQSPYDPQARYSEKRATHWEGYKVHFSESCDPEPTAPHLITNVLTEDAPVPDCQSTDSVHQALAEKALLPAQHLVDGGYTDATLYHTSQTTYQLDLVGPTTPDVSPQAKAIDGFRQSHFAIDWQAQQATCPNNKTSQAWIPDNKSKDKPTILIRFHPQDCLACPLRSRCTLSAKGPRSLRILPQPQFLALQTARQRQETPAFQALYQQRAGIEGTLSQAVRRTDLRQTRFLGKAKTHLQHLATAAAINLLRIADFLMATPTSRSRLSHFARLAPT